MGTVASAPTVPRMTLRSWKARARPKERRRRRHVRRMKSRRDGGEEEEEEGRRRVRREARAEKTGLGLRVGDGIK